MSDPETGSGRSTRTLEAETVIQAPKETVFDLLVDVPRYDEFSKYLQSVEADGDGGPGTVYRLRFEWWRLSYTAVSRVEALERPHRIDWTVVKDLDAHGSWQLDPKESTGEEAVAHDGAVGEDAVADGSVTGDGENHATRVILAVEYDPGSVTPDIVDLPRFVSFDGVLERATPLVEREARTVLERLVAELEGDPRPIDLEIRHG